MDKVIATKGKNEIVSNNKGLFLIIKNSNNETMSSRKMPISHFEKLILSESFTLNYYDNTYLLKCLKYNHLSIEDIISKLSR